MTTDSGLHLDVAFSNLIRKLKNRQVGTTACHSQANDQAEKFYQKLKEALRVRAEPRWTLILPLAPVSPRSSVKEEVRITQNEFVFGRTLRLPGELMEPSKPTHFNLRPNENV